MLKLFIVFFLYTTDIQTWYLIEFFKALGALTILVGFCVILIGLILIKLFFSSWLNKNKERFVSMLKWFNFIVEEYLYVPLPNKREFGFTFIMQKYITQSINDVNKNTLNNDKLYWTFKEFNSFYNNLEKYWPEHKYVFEELKYKYEPLDLTIHINDLDYELQYNTEIDNLRKIWIEINKSEVIICIIYIEEIDKNVKKVEVHKQNLRRTVENNNIDYENCIKYIYKFYVIKGHKNKFINNILKKIYKKKNNNLVRLNILTSIPLDLEFCFKIFNI